jgi:hypothetical protein
MTPTKEIEDILFNGTIDTNRIIKLIPGSHIGSISRGDFQEINWLNTPGPIYTTFTDNCGTGQVEAMNNVGGDEDYHEIIFKQPFTIQELKETLTAAAIDPFDSYYFDGNKNWTPELIKNWWANSPKRIQYVLTLYEAELDLPDNLNRPLYGPRMPIPGNYKHWLDFYQNNMKAYLEWYILRLSQQHIILDEVNFDWTARKHLDKLFNSKRI